MQAGFQFIRYAIAAVALVPTFTAAVLLAWVSRDASRFIVRKWSVFFLALFGVRTELQFERGPEQLSSGGVIVGLDQQSVLDPTLGYASFDRRVLSLWNIEYALIPFFGWIAWTLGWVIVRQWPEQARRQLAKAAAYAGSGGLVFISAEGQRSKDGRLNPYKKGPAVLAIQSQAPVHPLYVHGSRARLPYGHWQIRPGRVVLRFLEPVPTRGLTYADRDALTSHLRAVGESEHARWQGEGAHRGDG
jgi:1-acyl-sn-glycerol-3-phosphate acyltransferase